MTNTFLVVYGAVDLFCIITMLIILSKFTTNVGSDLEIRYFRYMTICYISFVITEFIWVLGMGNILPSSSRIYDLIKILGSGFIPIMVYYWFCFAEIKFKSSFISKFRNRLIAFIPIILLIIIFITSFKTGIIFRFDNNMAIRGPGFNISGLVNNIYGVSIIIHALYLYFKNDNRSLRNTCIIQIVFIIVCTLGGFIDGIFIDTPVMPLTICLSFIYLFINLQEPQIFSDALTGLNNRRSADAYLQRMLTTVNDSNPLYLFMIDIDSFKNINDTYGHLEGDRALCVIGNLLQKVAEDYRGFCARWGGDEFMLIIANNEKGFQDFLRNHLNEELKKETNSLDLKYDLSLSMGYSLIDSSDINIKEVIDKADSALYRDKRY